MEKERKYGRIILQYYNKWISISTPIFKVQDNLLTNNLQT